MGDLILKIKGLEMVETDLVGHWIGGGTKKIARK